jgi:hypothetical protein
MKIKELNNISNFILGYRFLIYISYPNTSKIINLLFLNSTANYNKFATPFDIFVLFNEQFNVLIFKLIVLTLL